MSFASRLWRLRSKAQDSEDSSSGKLKAALINRLGGRTKAEPAGQTGTREVLFDSFVAKAERELAPALPIETSSLEDSDSLRQAERYTPTNPSTTLVDNKGKRHRARIINFSATGVAIEADFAAVPAESITHVGSMRVTTGRPMRHGMVFLFEKPLDPARCSPQTVL